MELLHAEQKTTGDANGMGKKMIRDNSSIWYSKIIIRAKAMSREMINNDGSMQQEEKKEAGGAKDQEKILGLLCKLASC